MNFPIDQSLLAFVNQDGVELQDVSGHLNAQFNTRLFQLLRMIQSKYPKRHEKTFTALEAMLDERLKGAKDGNQLVMAWLDVMTKNSALKRALQTTDATPEAEKNEKAEYVFEHADEITMMRVLNIKNFAHLFRPVDKRALYDMLVQLDSTAVQATCMQSSGLLDFANKFVANSDNDAPLDMAALMTQLLQHLSSASEGNSLVQELQALGVLPSDTDAVEAPANASMQRIAGLMAGKGFSK